MALVLAKKMGVTKFTKPSIRFGDRFGKLGRRVAYAGRKRELEVLGFLIKSYSI